MIASWNKSTARSRATRSSKAGVTAPALDNLDVKRSEAFNLPLGMVSVP